jgi:hypothetical protein
VLIVSGAFAYLADGFNAFSNYPVPPLNVLAVMLTFFAFSGVIWGPLYTWMVIVMLIWGRGRSTDDIRRLYLFSPVLLGCSMGLPILVTDPATAGIFLLEGILRMNNMGFAIPILLQGAGEDPFYIGIAWLFMAGICIVVGYTFVGIVLWVERLLQKRGKFKDETPGS